MKTVLLIEDDRVSSRILSRWLEKNGWKVHLAVDGQDGLEKAAEHNPTIIICDLMMPRCNGFQFCRQLREGLSKARNTRVVVTTSSDYAADRKKALEAGADRVITKPVQREGLILLLEQLLKQGPRPEVLPDPPTDETNEATLNFPPSKHVKEATSPARIKFWGVRGSIATPEPQTARTGGNTTCVELRADGEVIVLDSGTGIRPLGLDLVNEFKANPIALTILLTHTHWDHIQGFPFFVPAYNPSNKIRVLGYEGTEKGLTSTLSDQMESPYFPISMQEMPSYIGFEELQKMSFRVGKVRVKAHFVNHPGICVGYRLNTSSGTVCFIPDNESFQRQKAEAVQESDEHYDSILEFARKEDEKLIKFIKGADILILDSQYDAEEYPSRVGWGHTCVDDSVALAIRAGVKKLFLFHHDPGHDDDHIDRIEKHANQLVKKAGSDLIVEAAREGVSVPIEKTELLPA